MLNFKNKVDEQLDEVIQELLKEIKDLDYDSKEYAVAIDNLKLLNEIRNARAEADNKRCIMLNWIRLALESIIKTLELIFDIKMRKADLKLREQNSENWLATIYDGYAFEKDDMVTSDTLKRVLNRCKLLDK